MDSLLALLALAFLALPLAGLVVALLLYRRLNQLDVEGLRRQVTDLQDGVALAHDTCLGSKASWRASVRMLNASTRPNMSTVAAPISGAGPVGSI